MTDYDLQPILDVVKAKELRRRRRDLGGVEVRRIGSHHRVRKTYVAVFERDESGWWTVRVKGVAGCLTQARSIGQGKARIREALELFVDDARTAELVVEVRISAREKRAITRLRAMRKAAEAAQRDAAVAARKIARELVTHMSVRDAAEVMGVSGGRVQQLVDG